MRKGAKTYGLYGSSNSNLSDDKIVRKELKYSDIDYHFNNKDIIIPDYQRQLDSEKIDELVEEINLNNGYLNNCTNPIQLASIEIGDNIWKHYILDGQHRFIAINKVSKILPNIFQSFVLHKCSSEKEAIIVFEKLIKGQEKLYLLSKEIFTQDFRDSKEFKFREYLKKYYPEHFVTSEKNKWVYTIDTFLKELKNRGLFELTKCKNEIKMKDFLFKRLIKFSAKNDYQTMITNNSKLLYKKEIEILEKCQFICLGLKRNNFIDYIFTSKIKKIRPNHSWKEAKDVIPKKLKNEVWKIYYQEKTKKKCPITDCKKFISSNSFSTGHLISEQHGGKLNIDNLHPICISCNSKMGIKKWEDFDNSSYLKIIDTQERLEI